MPATEKTWRDTMLLHLVFGLTALGMLGATVWMLYKDHNRAWKQYQRTYRKIDVWRTEGRLREEETFEYPQKLEDAETKLAEARSAVPKEALVEEFGNAVVGFEPEFNWEPIQQSYETLAAEPTAARRTSFLDRLQKIIAEVKVREENALREMKFARADLDVVKSQLGLAIGEGATADDERRLKIDVERMQDVVDERTVAYESVNTHRLALEDVLSQIQGEEAAAHKELEAVNAEIARLHETMKQRTVTPAEGILSWPILSAFNSPDEIEQIWLPDLKVDYNFAKVARFDRCITCHQGIQRTAPGSAVEPYIESERQIVLQLSTERQPLDADGNPLDPTLDRLNDFLDAAYGMLIADEGLLDPNDVTVHVVYPESPAARAGIEVGDVIERVNDAGVIDRQSAMRYLLELVDWGEPLELTVRRGLPHPYASHPRLDLYLGSFSPHQMMDFGCTTCHEGQGSATDFRWAAHSPNDPHERRRWREEYGWVSNHYVNLGVTHLWDFPMYPERFNESTCLKCHHEVVELGASEQFPDPPAPKVLAGYELVKTYGCFGCHAINGYDGPDMRVGPDLRIEPPYSAAALQLLTDQGLTDQERQLAHTVVEQPNRTEVRQRLAVLIQSDADAAEQGETPRLSAATHELVAILGADNETPGQLRKVGPSLRYVAHKVDRKFLYDWIREPSHFRPTTRMPQFFGLWDHLKIGVGDESAEHDAHGDEQHAEVGDVDLEAVPDTEHGEHVPEGLAVAQRYEPVEIYALTEYLLNQSQSFQYDEMPESADAERGKKLFQTRGCLACHQHKDFPQAAHKLSNFGPDLSRMGAKLAGKGEDGKKWLYTWIRRPDSYHARTKMPDVKLETYMEGEGDQAQEVDPAADIVAYLFESSEPWQPSDVPELDGMLEALDELTLEYLNGTFTESQARRYLKQGIPEALAAELKGAEIALVGEGQVTTAKKVDYIGRKTIAKYGCFGCHDVPGFEDAKPIGTTLTEWGRKDTSRLAFEQINSYVAHEYGDGHHVDPEDLGPDIGFYVHALMHHRRDGFIWQKLHEPRSYDYKKTETIGYNERLRMPKFPLDEEQIDAVITFVLGLVADPPMAKYVYDPPPRRAAQIAGQKVIDQFNCAACHMLEPDAWELAYDPDNFTDHFGSSAPYTFDFLEPHFTPQEIAASKEVDRRGLAHATVVGRPMQDASGEVITDEHPEEEFPVNYFNLWKPAVLSGEVWVVGGPSLMVPLTAIENRRPQRGGYLANYLHPIVLENAPDPNVKPSDAWGWVPPPLVNEGIKVQTDWLHEFLLDPYPIRPATVLRMPKFNMSSEDASNLVDYFAAVDDADFPYEFDPRSQESHLAAMRAENPNYLEDAFNIVTDNNYCVKCHLVGDYTPPGSVTALAPNLDQVHRRMRPQFLREWLAKPKSLLPYTGMPENFEKPVPQELYKGDRLEQLDAVVDLLLNYDRLMKNKTSVSSMVKPPADPQAQAGGQ